MPAATAAGDIQFSGELEQGTWTRCGRMQQHRPDIMRGVVVAMAVLAADCESPSADADLRQQAFARR